MPFIASNSPYYKVEITLPGYGKTPRLSTKTKRKALARKMENALHYIWEDGRHDLIEALEPQGKGQGGRIELPTLYHAWRQDALQSLERRLNDPPLAKAIRKYARRLDYDNHRRGARHILRTATELTGPLLAGEEARLSWLYDPGHIDRLLQHMIHEDGYAVNTVRNEPYGFISKFLRHRLGEADAHQILAEVSRPNEDDRREVWLTSDDVRRVVSASEWEVRMFLVLTTSTGIDKTPALRIQHRDVDFDEWTLFVRDTKTKSRRRSLQLAPVALFALKLLFENTSGDTAFDLRKSQLDYRWRKARKNADLTPEEGFENGVRLKDQRHTFAVHYMKGGGSIAGLQGRLGHSRGAQSMMYARHEVEETTNMEEAAQSMGLTLPENLKEKLPERSSSAQNENSIPAWWFDPDEPPRLIDGDEEETLSVPARKDEGGGGGGRRGFEPEDYRRAVEEEGSIAGAARRLDVNESTVREQCIRHEIEVPSIGGVPGQ